MSERCSGSWGARPDVATSMRNLTSTDAVPPETSIGVCHGPKNGAYVGRLDRRAVNPCA
jgi:hypothetical protein